MWNVDINWKKTINPVVGGLSKVQNLLNIRYERMDPGRLKSWQVEPSGLRIQQGGAEAECIPWDEVSELVTFKRDYGASDQVCLGFRRGEADAYTVLEEDNPAWPQVLPEVEARFPLPAHWFEAVMDPPFECNWTTIWGEPAARRLSG
jgi:hypothetical protein